LLDPRDPQVSSDPKLACIAHSFEYNPKTRALYFFVPNPLVFGRPPNAHRRPQIHRLKIGRCKTLFRHGPFGRMIPTMHRRRQPPPIPTSEAPALDRERALARWVSFIKTARCSGSKTPLFSTWGAPPVEPLDYVFASPQPRVRGPFSMRTVIVRRNRERVIGRVFRWPIREVSFAGRSRTRPKSSQPPWKSHAM
jgi:hypothetical protein